MKNAWLIQCSTGAMVEAGCVDDVPRRELVALHRRWRDFKRNAILVRYAGQYEESGHDAWDWPRKHDENEQTSRIFGVVHDKQIEGLMMVAREPISSRIAGAAEDRILHVEYIESAPWNLERYVGGDREYRGVGTALIGRAVKLSVDAGYLGRIGLHALKNAEGFYRRTSFIEAGYDEAEELNWFELPAQVERTQGEHA